VGLYLKAQWITQMQKINETQLKQLIEAGVFVADGPLSIDAMKNTFLSDFLVSTAQIKEVLSELELDYAPRGIHLVKVANGYRFQSDDGLGALLTLARKCAQIQSRYDGDLSVDCLSSANYAWRDRRD
jgi:chromosome segregation and condensation protein ScpB